MLPSTFLLFFFYRSTVQRVTMDRLRSDVFSFVGLLEGGDNHVNNMGVESKVFRYFWRSKVLVSIGFR